jgi:ubiquitin-like modifier-activating enzyme ATG7
MIPADPLRPPPSSQAIRGIFKNFNTIEQFKSTDAKKAVFDQVADSIYASFDQDEPDLHQFLLVTFADLKKYVYQYWFAFPALVSKPGWELDGELAEVSEEVSCLACDIIWTLRRADAQDVREARALEPAGSSTNGANNNGYLMRGPAGQRESCPLGQATSFFANTPDEEASQLSKTVPCAAELTSSDG